MTEQPEQVGDEQERPAPDEAGEGEENSARPIQDEARPDDTRTSGF